MVIDNFDALNQIPILKALKDCCFSKDIMSGILKIGIPTLMFQILTVISVAMTNDAATEYGSSALAAMGAVKKIMLIGTVE